MLRTISIVFLLVGAASVHAEYTDKYMVHSLMMKPASAIKTGNSNNKLDANVYNKVRKNGINKPLYQAMNSIVTGSCWKIRIESGIENKKVTWYAGHEWPDVLSDMAKLSNLFVNVNHNKCVVAIATNGEVAKMMAQTDGDVWKISANSPLRKTLEDWGKRVNWHVDWQLDEDYIVEFPAMLIGKFYGTDGVLARVIKSYSDHEKPLRVRFSKANKVAIIEERKSLR